MIPCGLDDGVDGLKGVVGVAAVECSRSGLSKSLDGRFARSRIGRHELGIQAPAFDEDTCQPIELGELLRRCRLKELDGLAAVAALALVVIRQVAGQVAPDVVERTSQMFTRLPEELVCLSGVLDILLGPLIHGLKQGLKGFLQLRADPGVLDL